MPPIDFVPGTPWRILVIDDSELDRLWLSRRLTDGTMRVVEASDGLAGLELCRKDPPDLILLDLGLPFCDGFEVLRRLNDDERTRDVPVILVSGATDSVQKAWGLDLGAIDFVTKPYDVIELRARIRSALRTRRRQEALERRARLDGLTGLANRTALEARMAAEWSVYQRHGEALSMLVIDLDHFKRVNDRYGHAVGDEVLRRVARALAATVRTSDFAARLGGEEFVVIASRCESVGAVKTAERFREALAALPVTAGCEVPRVTASVGVASAPEQPVSSADELLARADEALYQAKATGRDRVISRGQFRAGATARGRSNTI